MIRSMTGFGRAEVAGDRVVVTVEAKSVNHRHLDVVFKMPRAFSAFEAEARRDVPGLHEALVVEVARIAVRLPAAAARREERLRERIERLIGEAGIDQSRVLTEVAIWAEKSDIAEELARLGSHLEQFALMLKDGGS